MAPGKHLHPELQLDPRFGAYDGDDLAAGRWSSGTQYVWSAWSDAGAISHTVTPSVGTTYTANFTTQYYLTMTSGAGGSASPGSLWTNSGTLVNIRAEASTGYAFSAWTGSGSGSDPGSNNPAWITMNGSISEAAGFAFLPTRIIVLSGDLAFGTVPVGGSSNLTLTVSNSGNSTLTVDGISYPTGFSGAWSGRFWLGVRRMWR